MKIIGNKIAFFNSATLCIETIEVSKVNAYLSNFYGERVDVCKNILNFSNDIIALCFGFKQRQYKIKLISGKVKVENYNNMAEAIFIESQYNKILSIKQIN